MGRKTVLRRTAAILLLLACRVQANAAVDSHIVSRVEVVCHQQDRVLRRQYSQERKMEAVLNYLRLARYAGQPEDMPLPGADSCRITVHLLPGGSHRYDLLDWQYLSRDAGPWELAEMPEGLPHLLALLPSDTEKTGT